MQWYSMELSKKLNKGEKHLKITCNNAGGRNKNNATTWFYLYYKLDIKSSYSQRRCRMRKKNINLSSSSPSSESGSSAELSNDEEGVIKVHEAKAKKRD